jgi:hypothetical protein
MPKEIDISRLDTDGLRNLVANHRKRDLTHLAVCAAALAELEKRTGLGLDFDKSFDIIRKAALDRRFVSYKELADASGAEWSRVHYAIGGHLWRLVDYGHHKGWPMLSAIVVNQQNVATGKMEQETRKGFLAAARKLGIPITDEETFLREQQQLVFDRAADLRRDQ